MRDGGWGRQQKSKNAKPSFKLSDIVVLCFVAAAAIWHLVMARLTCFPVDRFV